MAQAVFQQVLSEIDRFKDHSGDFRALQEFSVRIMAERLPHYNWVGFYMLDPQDAAVLVLGPFQGAPTEHVRIPVSQGICGAAVAHGETIIVEDITRDPRYLACSLETRSEIVVPIWANGKIVGEIDVDSHTLNAFGPADRRFLEDCATIFGRFLEAS